MNTESVRTLLELSILFLTIAAAVAIAVRHLCTNDVISEESYEDLTSQINTALAQEQITWRQTMDVTAELEIGT